MKQSKKLLLLMMLVSLSVLGSSSTQQATPRPPIILERGTSHGHINRPKMPERQTISCCYDGEGLLLSFLCSEGLSAISITDENRQIEIKDLDTSKLEIYIPVGFLSGIIYVQLRTQREVIYEGIIE